MNVATEKSTMKWYVVRAQSNREKSVSERLIKEGDKGDLSGKLGRIIVPMEKTFHMKGGKKVMKEKVMFPGYIFVETNAIGELKYFLKGITGASGFLTNRAGEVQVLTQAEVDGMLGQHQASEEKEISNTFVVGEEVKVLDGPFSGFVGAVEEFNGDKVKVGVLIFGRKTPVELSVLQVEKKWD